MHDATKIIENGFVFTGDGSNRAGRFSILVRNDRIAEVSGRGDLFKSLHPGAEVVDATNKVIFPGFLDPHFHGESFVLRLPTSGVPMSRWGRETSSSAAIRYVREQASLNELTSLYRLAYTAALKSGITGVSEFGLDRLDLSLKASLEAFRSAELRGWIGLHNGDQIDQARTMRHPTIRFTLPVPPEEDLTTYNLQSTIRTAKELQVPLVVQLGETTAGLETIRRNFNKTIVRFLEEYRLFGLPLHLVHVNALEPEDLELLSVRKLPLIVSPGSMTRKQNDQPPFAEFFRRGLPLAAATDWGAPDPFETMRGVTSMAQSLRMSSVTPHAVLAMHTRTAAAVLGVGSECGSIEAGKKADLTLVDVGDHRLGHPGTGSTESYLSVLLAELHGRDVSDVMVNGEFYVRQGHLLMVAEEDLQRELLEWQQLLGTKTAVGSRAGSPQPVAAPVIPLHAEHRENDEETGEGSESFRIIRRGAKDVTSAAVHERKETPAPQTLRGGVKRVFGDDDDVS